MQKILSQQILTSLRETINNILDRFNCAVSRMGQLIHFNEAGSGCFY